MKINQASKLILVLLTLWAQLFAETAFAQSNNINRSSHNFEVSIASGDLNLDQMRSEFNEDDAKHLQFSYDFQFDTGLYFGGGFLKGESGNFSPVDDIFGSDELEYNALFIKSGYRYTASEKHSLYAEILLLSHDVKLNVNDSLDTSETGQGWGYATGWQYQIANRIHVKLGLENIKFGNTLSIDNVIFGIGFRY